MAQETIDKPTHMRTHPGSKECICGSPVKYNERWDAYYCVASKEWVESRCDRWCRFCHDRPDTAP